MYIGVCMHSAFVYLFTRFYLCFAAAVMFHSLNGIDETKHTAICVCYIVRMMGIQKGYNDP